MFYLRSHPLIIKNIRGLRGKNIYLSFDDGPDSRFTSQILDLLAQEQWKASFFVIGNEAKNNLDLVKRMLAEGHSVLSHSKDHQYLHYFKNKDHLKNWLRDSLEDLSQITGQEQKAFRPPAGILTPPLLQAAEEMKIPLILWNQRFYDTVWPLTEKKVVKNLPRLSSGDIVLLHDRQPLQRQQAFIEILKKYIQEMKAHNYQGDSLSSSLISQQLSHF